MSVDEVRVQEWGEGSLVFPFFDVVWVCGGRTESLGFVACVIKISATYCETGVWGDEVDDSVDVCLRSEEFW